MPPTRQDLTQGPWPEGRLYLGYIGGGDRAQDEPWALLDNDAVRLPKGGPDEAGDFTASSLPLLDSTRTSRRASICYTPHQAYKCGTRSFFKWVRAQDRSPHAPGSPKNVSGLSAFPERGAAQVPGYKPNPSEEGKNLGGQPPEARECRLLPTAFWARTHSVGMWLASTADRNVSQSNSIMIVGEFLWLLRRLAYK